MHVGVGISMAWMKQTGRRKLIYTNSQWSKTTWTNRKNAYSGRLRRELFIVVWFLPHDAYVTNMHSALRAVKHVSSSVCHVNSIETAETVFNQLTLDCTSGTQVFITRNMQISGALNGRVVDCGELVHYCTWEKQRLHKPLIGTNTPYSTVLFQRVTH